MEAFLTLTAYAVFNDPSIFAHLGRVKKRMWDGILVCGVFFWVLPRQHPPDRVRLR